MNTNRPENTNAFTLIELLIVVLIIAILAAIAVPNFLEFQARAKVSRAKADMRSLVTAIEAYFVDNNDYPLAADEDGNAINPYPTGGPEYFETRIGINVTTPIAYITNRFDEPFPAVAAPENKQFHFSTLSYAFAHGNAAERDSFLVYTESMFSNPQAARYFIMSHGPDLDHDEPSEEPTVYDPTNGTLSSGDVIYFGPGLGFPH